MIRFVGGLLELVPPEAMVSEGGSLDLGLYAFFAKDGSLEHFFYSIPGVDAIGVAAAIENYSRSYRFPLEPGPPFKQCSTISLQGEG